MRVRFALPGALLLLLGSYGIGQEITATILGTVRDTSGAVISGATIIVVNTDQATPNEGSGLRRRRRYLSIPTTSTSALICRSSTEPLAG